MSKPCSVGRSVERLCETRRRSLSLCHISLSGSETQSKEKQYPLARHLIRPVVKPATDLCKLSIMLAMLHYPLSLCQ